MSRTTFVCANIISYKPIVLFLFLRSLEFQLAFALTAWKFSGRAQLVVLYVASRRSRWGAYLRYSLFIVCYPSWHLPTQS